nr:PREDICTED: uncharacterized protein LOC109032434 [Bemisia tabaci]XP_018900103.1 PREDICTED: uncharacterized protein LOC109032434 [Bemisia tabaci]XP_018900104.1 PREDICTED: uncharacterized protein LOC109032434 [Bemisia tabaci]XP_018900105.1 PREDICTED: uncharacterized protein LOC109032434 [Bemisia tabaci]
MIFYRISRHLKWKSGLLKKMASDTGDRTWGHLASTEIYGRPSTADEYTELTKEEINSEHYSSKTNACHCLLFARKNKKTFGVYNPRATVLMQMRFDGYIGFPGGLVDSGEDQITALNRELLEEMNLDTSTYKVTEENHIVSHYSTKKNICLHFYALEVPEEDIKKIEVKSLSSKDHGSEVLGVIQVPLYTMGDGVRGFPTFLTHSFIGNSRMQLLISLKKLNILTEDEITSVLNAVPTKTTTATSS